MAVRMALARIDTSICKGVARTVALLEEAEAVALPFVVLGELRAGSPTGVGRPRTSGSSGVSS